MLGALVLTPVLLVAEIWNSPQIESVRDRPPLALAPRRVGAGARGRARVADGAPARAARRAGARGAAVPGPGRGRRLDREPARAALRRDRRRRAGVARAAAAARHAGDARGALGRAGVAAGRLVVLYALQSAYSDDSAKALEQVVFFYVPFALLFALLRDLSGRRGGSPGPARAARARARVRRDRLLGVPDARAAAEPEGHRLQPGRGVLPRQLAVLRPQHLRALPGAGDDRARRRAAVDAPAAHAWRAARARS